MISLFNEDTPFPFKGKQPAKDKIKKLVVLEGKKPGDLNFIFCSDKYLLEINNKYLNHNYYTDVITFDYTMDNTIIGDIFISIDTVRENANEYKVPFEHELSRVMYHGVLHLCGYKDKTPEEETFMREKENHYLNIL